MSTRIFVAGGDTFVGSAIRSRGALSGLGTEGARPVFIDDPEPDLTDGTAVESFFERTRPDVVFVAAGRTAGIAGNQKSPADLMLHNLLAGTHVISASWRAGVRKLMYLASSCVYPKGAPQPYSPSSLWTGPVEPTSDAYAVAKLAGIRLCEAYRRQHGANFVVAIAADAYGPGDDFSEDNSHVAAALVRRIHEAAIAGAPSVDIWGSGTPRREFIYVDDLADAALFAMAHYDGAEPLNLGTGETTSIAEFAEAVRTVVGYKGELRFDTTKPDGMPYKGLDSRPLHALGWKPQQNLKEGLQKTYRGWKEKVEGRK
jgi:GDP-L-fucose synthase